MTRTVPIPFPRWHRVVRALSWELAWKNRVVFPALLVFVGLGAGLAWATNHAPPDIWWGKYTRGVVLVAFLGSVLLAFAPFTLMDSHGSWRMNSVTTRWSVLPVRTFFLVAVPLVMAWAVMGALVSAWTPILNRLFQGIDMTYVLAVFLAGAVAAQALAWAIPRKPGQFWVAAALLLLMVLLAAVIPPDRGGWEEVRSRAFHVLGWTTLGFALVALWSARRNRCGDWPGELPLVRLNWGVRRTSARTTVFRNPTAALFWSEVAPSCRSFVVSWVVLAVLLMGWACASLWLHRPGVRINWFLIALGMLVEGLPNFGVLWLLGWGLLLGCEPGLGFQTRLSGFRATRPLTVGVLAGTRISSLALIWLCVWLPLLALQPLIGYAGLPEREVLVLSQQASDIIAGRMTFTASAMVGALPIVLWGRLEGFPTVFLATLVAWVWTWILGGFAYQQPPPPWLGTTLAGLIGLKFAVAAGLLLHSHRQGQITWRFPAGLLGGWLAVVAFISWQFAPWQGGDVALTLAPVVMIPLVRLAACPMAMAANRHG